MRILAALLCSALIAAEDAGSVIAAILAKEVLSDADRTQLRLHWQEASPTARARAITAIAERRDEELRPLVRESLSSAEGDVAAAAASGLGRLGIETSAEIDSLRGMLAHGESAARLAALQALVAVDDDGAVPRVLGWVAGNDPTARNAAIDAVRKLMPVGVPADPGQWSAWWQSERDRAGRILDAFSAALASDKPDAISAAIRAHAGDRNLRGELVPLIQPLLAHRHPDVARLAELALRGLRGPGADLALAEHRADLASGRLTPAAAPPPVAVAAAPAPQGSWLPMLALVVSASLVGLAGFLVVRQRQLSAPAERATSKVSVTRSTSADGTRTVRRVVTFADGSQMTVVRKVDTDGHRVVTRRIAKPDGTKKTVTRSVGADGEVTLTKRISRADGSAKKVTKAYRKDGTVTIKRKERGSDGQVAVRESSRTVRKVSASHGKRSKRTPDAAILAQAQEGPTSQPASDDISSDIIPFSPPSGGALERTRNAAG